MHKNTVLTSLVLFNAVFAYFVCSGRCVSFILYPDSISLRIWIFLRTYCVLIVQLQLDMNKVKSLLALFVEV